MSATPAWEPRSTAASSRCATHCRTGTSSRSSPRPATCPARTGWALVKTSRARNKIKHVINISERAKAIEIGTKLLEKEARRLGVSLSRVGRAELERVAGEYGYSKMEDLHAALGYGRFSRAAGAAEADAADG